MKSNRAQIFSHWMAKIVLIFVIQLLAGSCNTQREQQVTDYQTEMLQGKISFWVEMSPQLTKDPERMNQKVFQNLITEFSELHPQVQIFAKSVPQENIWELFEAQGKLGAGPDILLVSATSDVPRLIREGLLRAIDNSAVDQSQFRSEGLNTVRYQGQFYGFPLLLSTQVLCYNRDKVQELPRSLSELIEQARRGYSVGLHSGFSETFWGTGIFDDRQIDDSSGVILSQIKAWGQWMGWLKKARNEPNFILSSDAIALQQAFVEGKLAYLTCKPAWIDDFREVLGSERVGAMLLPGEANQPATPLLESGILIFNRASNSNQHRLALKLAQFLTNVEQQEQIEAAVPFIPSNQKVMINQQLFPLRNILLEQSRISLGITLDNVEKVELIEEYGNILYRQVLNGELSPDEAATQLTQIVNSQVRAE